MLAASFARVLAEEVEETRQQRRARPASTTVGISIPRGCLLTASGFEGRDSAQPEPSALASLPLSKKKEEQEAQLSPAGAGRVPAVAVAAASWCPAQHGSSRLVSHC